MCASDGTVPQRPRTGGDSAPEPIFASPIPFIMTPRVGQATATTERDPEQTTEIYADYLPDPTHGARFAEAAFGPGIDSVLVVDSYLCVVSLHESA
jgi:hypothetical protein